MNLIRGYDAETLRELIDPRECQQRLEEIGMQRSLPALLERVWLLKVLGDFDESLKLSEQSVRTARMSGTRQDLLRSRVLHASVVHSRGNSSAAIQELTMCADEAQGQRWPSIAAFALQHRGRVHFDNGDYENARSDFKQVLFLRQQAGLSEEELSTTLLYVDTADRRWAHSAAGKAQAATPEDAELLASVAAEAERASESAAVASDANVATGDAGADQESAQPASEAVAPAVAAEPDRSAANS